VIGLEYIVKIFEYEFKDIALLLGIDKANISIWLNGRRKIPKKWLSYLSDYFKLPEHLFQKELDMQEQLKISIQYLGDIHFYDSPDDINDLISLNEALAGIFNFINSSTPKIAEIDLDYAGAEDELHVAKSVTTQHYLSSISRMEMFLKNAELDLGDKESIFRTIHLLTFILDKAIQDKKVYEVAGEIERKISSFLDENDEEYCEE
jgi:DNA-binding transcriptional regulator YdaS (Cro superfamily)